jgi:hypothetical protein
MTEKRSMGLPLLSFVTAVQSAGMVGSSCIVHCWRGSSNHLYGAFTAAMKRIVGSGCAKAALSLGTVGCDATSHAGSAAEERDVCVDEVTIDPLEVPVNPWIEDADPDCFPHPKDGDLICWILSYRWLKN